MGVHISFVRSTNLDSWQLQQLRTMKVGGNASATDFFTRNGGSTLLSDSDTKKKYSGRIAELYKAELAKRVKEDALKFPRGIIVDGMETVTPAQEAEPEDFFTTWDKPSSAKVSGASTPRIVPSPSRIGGSPSPSATPAPQVPPAPRTTSSAALQSSSATASRAAKLGGSRLNSSSSKPAQSTAPKKTKLGGLGAKITPTTIDFEEAERKAAAEAERIKQLGYDRQREEEEERARKEAEALETAAQQKAMANNIGYNPNGTNGKTTQRQPNQPGFTRLGFGAIPGAGAAAPAPSLPKSSTIADDAPTAAREKFGNQKAISSDMYFGRNSYDPSAVSEAQSRLQSFQGATSISSNQYFGREDEEDHDRSMEGGLLGDGSLAGLEVAAKEAIAKVLANPDVQNVGETIRTGALKISDYLAQMSER